MGRGSEGALGRGGGARGRLGQGVVVGACLLRLLVVGEATVSHAAEPVAPMPAVQSMPQPPNGERFLQNVISQSLGQGSPAPAIPTAPPSPGPQSPVPSSQPPQTTGDLTAATLKMVLSLGGILGLLVLGGYVIRRFWLDQTFLGKRTPMMRVLARVNITPKAGVALLEVPGKVLVIGLTGSTMVALGELTTATIQPLEHPPVETPSSFASALETSTGSFVEEGKGADALLKVSEAIQQKMRRLKQL
jgi:flagellar biogenesis protein FliO